MLAESWSRGWGWVRRCRAGGTDAGPGRAAAGFVRTRRCWWCCTTVSTWPRRAPGWSSGCCGRRGCGCWPPAARSWGVPGEAVWPSRPWPSALAVPAPASAGTAGLDLDLDRTWARVSPRLASPPRRWSAMTGAVVWNRAVAADPVFVLMGSTVRWWLSCPASSDLPLANRAAAAASGPCPWRSWPPAWTTGSGSGWGWPDHARRQQTLRATIDWSWELLEEADRRLWRRLSVFSGAGRWLRLRWWVAGMGWRGTRCWRVGPVGGSVVGGGGGGERARFGLRRVCGPMGASGSRRRGSPGHHRPPHTSFFLSWPSRPPPTEPPAAAAPARGRRGQPPGCPEPGGGGRRLGDGACAWPAPSAGTGRPAAPSRAASGWPGSSPWRRAASDPPPGQGAAGPGHGRRAVRPAAATLAPRSAARSCSRSSGTGRGPPSPSCCGLRRAAAARPQRASARLAARPGRRSPS